MDAGVWSHADIRNGRRLFIALAVILLIQQAFGVACIAGGVPLAPLEPATGPLAALPDVVRYGAGLALTAILLVFAARGRSWGRLSFGLVSLSAAATMAYRSVPALLHEFEGQGTPATHWALGLLAASVLAILSSLALMGLPPLRAYTWHRATTRDAIPVPLDNEPAPRRVLRRLPTFGERVVAFAQAVGNGFMILGILALWALLAGFGQWVDRFLTP